MQTYTSRTFTLGKDAQTIEEMVKNPAALQPYVDKFKDKLPMKNLQLTADGVTVDAPIVGNVTFTRVETNTPGVIKYEGKGAPVPVALNIFLKPEGDKTSAQLSLDADIPSFMGGMIEGKAKSGLGKAADLLEKLDFDRLFKK